MPDVLVVGNDKICRKFLNTISVGKEIRVVIDESSGLRRTWRLVRRGVLKPSLVMKMALAEFLRPDYKTGELPRLKSNGELLKIIKESNAKRVFLFRAGLIINKKVIDSGVDLMNVHCAKIPEYGGLGVIDRALKDKAFDQLATLHRVTEKIDDGEVLDVEPYRLNPSLSYAKNEMIAYEAGIRLLQKVLS
jgi:methionyl-tRNA formyltransferase